MSMIEKTLVRFKTKDLFNKRLGLKEIPETSICFIEDTKEIWTHGQFYAIPNEEVFISNGEEPTGNEEIWIDLSEDSPVTDIDLSNYATKKYVDDNISNLSTVATTGSYNDLSDKPNVVIKNDSEESAMEVLVQLLNNIDQNIHTCTQEQYNTLKALFKDVTKNTSVLLKPSSGLVEYMAGSIPSDVLFIYDYERSGGIQMVFNGSREYILSGRSSIGLLVESDLSLQDTSVLTVINTANEDRFVITQQFKNGDNSNSSKRIDLLLNGSGTKALMDNGSYKEVWTPDNDGSESGLDADMLDGYHINNIQLGGWYNFVTYEYTEDKVLLYNWIKLLDLSQINSDGYIELEIDVPGDNNYPTLERLFIKISRFNNNKYNSISIKVNGLLDNEIKVLSKIDGNRTVWICIKAAWNGNKSRIRLVGQESLNIDLSSLTTQTNEPEGGSDIVYGKCGIRLDLDTNTFRYYYDPDLNEENLAYWYEIDEDSPSTILETGGNRSVIESLKSKFRRCIAMPYGDDAAMVSYCKESYSAEWPDGTTIEIKSNHQNRMVHFPKYYHKTVKRFSNIWRTYISEQQLDNDYVEEPEALLASFEGAINSEGMLISTAHQTSASSKTINEFVTAAKTHGPLWGIGDYRTHATIARMFCAYYKNTNISTNSNIPCSGGTKRYNYGLTGSTIHLGNIDGKRETLEDVGYYSTNFLGLEDCYYSKWEFVQGINILKGKYVVYDGGSFPDKDVDELEAAGATNIRIVGYEPNPSATDKYSGWIKSISQGRYGDVLPTALGGSETTYYSDYSWFNPTANRIFLRSGDSANGPTCGVFVTTVGDDSYSSSAPVGARLAFYGKIVVVDSDTFKKNQV